jgi:hypothetical protein
MNIDVILYKNSRFVTTSLFVVTVIIAVIACKNTVWMVFRYFELQNGLKAISHSPRLSRQTEYSIEEMESVDLNAILFSLLSQATNKSKVKVKNFNYPALVSEDNYQTITQEVILEGDFVNTLKCLRETGTQLKYVKLCSLTFERDLSPKNNVLYTKAYFQVIKIAK